MPARLRTKKLGRIQPGSLYQVLSNGQQYKIASGSSGYSKLLYMNDSTQPEPYTSPQGLFSKVAESRPLRISGTYTKGQQTYRAVNYNPTKHSDAQYAPHYATSVDLNKDYWITKALAGMNPDIPAVDLPLFLFELKDIPRMYRQVKKYNDYIEQARFGTLPDISGSDIPELILSANFAWKPLFRDLYSLSFLADEISDMASHKEKLERGHRFSRALGERETGGFDGVYTFGNTRWATSTKVYEKVWFTAFAELQNPIIPALASPGPAIRRALGLNASAATAWNAIPFSWLVDYFANVGDILNARRGSATIKYKNFCLMITKKYTFTVGPKIYGPLEANGGELSTTFKTRAVVSNPQPRIARTSYLSDTQIANVGALLASSLIN